MTHILRDSIFGRIVRFIFRDKVFLFPEEQPGFDYAICFQPNSVIIEDKKDQGPQPGTLLQSDNELHVTKASESTIESGDALSVPNDSTKVILVNWYSQDDPQNPQNWSLSKKLFIYTIMCVYTFCVYLGSSIYTPSTDGVMKEFNVGYVPATLGLALYILGYGTGPLLWSPLSEIPAVGRTPPYVITFAIFVVICVPAALTKSFAGLCIVRFLMGFFGSPALTTGAATFQDMFPTIKMPYLLALWGGSATFGPAIGPVVAGFSVTAENWRWPQWETLWFSAPIFLALLFFMPETNPDTILMQRAQRIRQITKRSDIKSQSEINQSHMSSREITYFALIKPWEINILDPSVLFTTVYISLVYATFYSFFESFPLVYPTIYGFNLGQTGLAFMSVIVGLAVAIPGYCIYYYYWVEPAVIKHGWGEPEDRLKPAILGAYMIPIGVFLFAWTTRRGVHWMPSIVGVGLNNAGQFFILQPVFMYLTMTYPRYAASLMAANDFARSVLAAVAVLVSRPMFTHLGVPGGVSLLGGLNIVCIGGVYIMYYHGSRLRARSRFTQK
ncbi:major facilitator superfamily domain-containing protein [Xylogone sp. PMI_703]|nr:major facilitator superfamily domain-containing protein [Xylogone sp. PMI_703]